MPNLAPWPTCERAFFLNSTTLGIRIYPVSRRTLARSSETVSTAFGPISVKVAALDGAPLSAGPEYEDCRRGAAKAGVPVRKVWTAAVAASEALLASAARHGRSCVREERQTETVVTVPDCRPPPCAVNR